MPPRCLMSVDVEDYFHVEAFASTIRREDWPSYSPRVERNTMRVLDLLDRHGARATFFILGWVAEREPRLVREIVARNHEAACHSYWHRRVYTISRDEFREDTRRARGLLEEITGRKVRGYRAPSFSVIRKSLWALEILAGEGFEYDASIYPVRHDHYGIPDWNPAPGRVETAAGPIFEFPGSSVRLAGVNVPCGGGGYLRLLPPAFNRWALERILAERGTAMIYLHPWELDPEQPRIPAGWRSRFRHYTNLSRTEERLGRLLGQFSTESVGEYLDRQ
jgi:polysaccharide deacetylase family protein (PEP-CTERM system associated)